MRWHDYPGLPGLYLVRPRVEDFLAGSGVDVRRAPARAVRLEPGETRFDAGDMAGTVDAPCWEWSGPVLLPDAV